MELIDTHCHLPKTAEETNIWLQNATANDVVQIINIGTNLRNSSHGIKRAAQYKNIFTTVGIYPQEEREESVEILQSKLEQLITQPKVVAIGECGYDVSNWERQRPISEQERIFEMQIELAIKHNLPVIIHNRNGDEPTKNTLKKYKNTSLTGVAHCFDSDLEMAKFYLDHNFLISFTGFITRQSKTVLHEVAKYVPLSKIMVETDSPYIVPSKVKEELNQPKNVKIIAQRLAELKGISLEEVAEITTNTARQLFSLPTAEL